MIVVLDTNVLVSALLTPGGNCDRILTGCKTGRLTPVASAEILAEYHDVLRRPHLGFEEKDVLAVIALFSSIALAKTLPIGLPDPDDEIFIHTALAARARHLITGNIRHYPSSKRRGVSVVLPAEFIRIWNP